jgi:ornithine carbamoyltransferase
MRHALSVEDIDRAEVRDVLDSARAWKRGDASRSVDEPARSSR